MSKPKSKILSLLLAVVLVSATFATFGIVVGAAEQPGAPVITITTQPKASTFIYEGYTTDTLSVDATVTEGALLGYEWYVHTKNANIGGVSTGESESSFKIPENLKAGVYYYYCVVQATDGKTLAKEKVSNVAKVTVEPKVPPSTMQPSVTPDSGTFNLVRNAADTAFIQISLGTSGDVKAAYATADISGSAAALAPMKLSYDGYFSVYARSAGTAEIDVTFHGGDVTDTSYDRHFTVNVTDPYAPPATYPITVTSGTASPNPAEAGTTVTLTADAPVPGKQFAYWHVYSGNVSVVSSTNAVTTFTMPANEVGVEARYGLLPVAHTVSYSANGGTGSMSADTIGRGNPYTVKPNDFTREGYIFTNWNTQANGAGTSYAPLATIPNATSDITLYAQWVKRGDLKVYSITFDPNGGTFPDGDELAYWLGGWGIRPTDEVTGALTNYSELPLTVRSGYTFNGWYTARSGGTRISTSYVFSADTTVYAQWTSTGKNNGKENDRDRGGSSGGGGGGSTAATTPSTAATAPKDVTTAAANSAATAAAQTAKASGASTATVNIKNPVKITQETLQSTAQAADMPVRFQADSMSADGKTVEVRIVLDPAKATKDLNLSASTTNATAKAREAFFEKWFKNDVSVVNLGQKSSFGFPVELAVKIDPKLNTEKLEFYSYDAATNSYKRIEGPAYWIDKNGYVHFTTEMAGDIIISEGLLEEK